MRQMLIRSAILIAACGSAGSAYCAPLIFFGGFYRSGLCLCVR